MSTNNKNNICRSTTNEGRQATNKSKTATNKNKGKAYIERFFTPENRKNFTKWLLEETVTNQFVVVFEHKNDEAHNILRKEATIVLVPKSVRHHYVDSYRLTAVINPRITEKFINQLMQSTSVLSVHNETEMIFLIADDFHADCFSCYPAFYDDYYKILQERDLI